MIPTRYDATSWSTPYNRLHLYKALAYFRDAEAEPMPDMLVPLEWRDVTTFFVAEVPHLSGFRRRRRGSLPAGLSSETTTRLNRPAAWRMLRERLPTMTTS